MSWIVAGIMVAGKAVSASNANKAERDANTLATYQTLIDTERMKADVALADYNMTNELASIESEQVAMTSAMGKRSDSAGLQRLQEVGRDDLQENVNRMYDEVGRKESYDAVTLKARDKTLQANKKTRTTGAVTSGLLSFSKAFA